MHNKRVTKGSNKKNKEYSKMARNSGRGGLIRKV